MYNGLRKLASAAAAGVAVLKSEYDGGLSGGVNPGNNDEQATTTTTAGAASELRRTAATPSFAGGSLFSVRLTCYMGRGISRGSSSQSLSFTNASQSFQLREASPQVPPHGSLASLKGSPLNKSSLSVTTAREKGLLPSEPSGPSGSIRPPPPTTPQEETRSIASKKRTANRTAVSLGPVETKAVPEKEPETEAARPEKAEAARKAAAELNAKNGDFSPPTEEERKRDEAKRGPLLATLPPKLRLLSALIKLKAACVAMDGITQYAEEQSEKDGRCTAHYYDDLVNKATRALLNEGRMCVYSVAHCYPSVYRRLQESVIPELGSVGLAVVDNAFLELIKTEFSKDDDRLLLLPVAEALATAQAINLILFRPQKIINSSETKDFRAIDRIINSRKLVDSVKEVELINPSVHSLLDPITKVISGEKDHYEFSRRSDDHSLFVHGLTQAFNSFLEKLLPTATADPQ